MTWFDRMERRFGWLSFPHFLRYYALLHGLVFALQFVRPNIASILEFDAGKILSGEVWRLVTFLFASSGLQGTGFFGLIFFIFMVMIAFMMSDALEGAWGTFKTSLFFHTGALCLLAGNFVFGNPMPGVSGFLLYGAAFLAFATLFPKVEFLMFLIIPVQVRFLAWIQVGLMVLSVFGDWRILPFYLLAFANYIVWAGIPALRGTLQVIDSSQRRRSFKARKMPEEIAFHRCEACGRTEADDPSLEFRVGPDGREYCEDHLPVEKP